MSNANHVNHVVDNNDDNDWRSSIPLSSVSQDDNIDYNDLKRRLFDLLYRTTCDRATQTISLLNESSSHTNDLTDDNESIVSVSSDDDDQENLAFNVNDVNDDKDDDDNKEYPIPHRKISIYSCCTSDEDDTDNDDYDIDFF